jgi:hypothetical protein
LDWRFLLGLIPLGVLITIAYSLISGRAAERRELRREGARVVTPVQEILRRLGPAAVTFGSDDQIRAGLVETHGRWQNEVRANLREYANHHPCDRVRKIAVELAEAVDKAYVSTQWFFGVRDQGQAMQAAYEAADRQQREAVETAERLMAEIRRRRPRLPQRS